MLCEFFFQIHCQLFSHTLPCVWIVYVLVPVTKCRKNLLLTKNRLTNADDFVEFSETAASSCDSGERFNDGTDRENIKCTTTRERVALWSQQESACHGTTLHYSNSNLCFRRNVKQIEDFASMRKFKSLIELLDLSRYVNF